MAEKENTEEVQIASSLTCNLLDDEKTYTITTKNDEIVKISDNIKEIINVDDYENSDEIFSAIEKYYLKNNGKCS